MPSTDDSIIMVGAGVFGLSTTLELRLRGYHKITVIDRMLPPVPDGSSVDISRVIRSDYTDPFYAKLASEAMDAWISDDWKQFYYNSGFVISSVAPNEPFVEKCKNVLREQNRPYTTFKSSAELIGKYPSLKGGLTNGASGYINHFGGWADAAEAIRRLAARCSELSISFITRPSKTVQSLITNESCVVGVRTMTGPIYGSRIILATGAWTNRLTDLTFAMSSSGQPVGFIQLTPEEAKSISNMPVVIDFTTGCFIFPPTPNDHVLKIARHSHGFEAEVPAQNERVVSAPKYLNGTISSFIPEDADTGLRDSLQHFLPQFVKYPWLRRRLCWYTDTRDGNFVVGSHPRLEGLFIAAGGAGHAFKFLPVLGRYIADCFEDRATEEVRTRWKIRDEDVGRGPVVCNDGSRRGPPRRFLSRSEQAHF